MNAASGRYRRSCPARTTRSCSVVAHTSSTRWARGDPRRGKAAFDRLRRGNTCCPQLQPTEGYDRRQRALITGITGQDGAYLPNCCSPRATRRTASNAARRRSTASASITCTTNSTRPKPKLYLHYGDLTDSLEPAAPSCSSCSPMRSTTSVRKGRGGVVRGTRIHGERRRARHARDRSKRSACVGGDAALPLLSGVDVGAVSARWRRRRRPRRHRFIRARRTASPSCTRTGSRRTIAKRTACSRAAASCSITSRRSAAKPSSRARSRAALRAAPASCCTASISAISTREARSLGHARDYVQAPWLMLQQGDAARLRHRHRRAAHRARIRHARAQRAIGVELEFRGEGAQEHAIVARCDVDGGKLKPGDTVAHSSAVFPAGRSRCLLVGDSSLGAARTRLAPHPISPAW